MIPQFVTDALVLSSQLAVLGTAFWLISLLLPKPDPEATTARNFTCAHKPTLINKEFKCEIFYPFISFFITQPLSTLAIFALFFFGFDLLPRQPFAEDIATLPVWIQVIIGIFVLDISLYIRHRFVHTYCWSYHAVHHCAQEIGWLTTKRLHPVDQFVMGVINFIVLYFLGFSAEGMVIANAIKDLNNFFVHSNIVLDYGRPLKYILVSPNMHRWHHATETQAHNKNYCVVFAFIDYFLGTYYVPDNALPKSYGTSYRQLDDIENKNIIKELYYPFVLTYRAMFRRRPANTSSIPLAAQDKAAQPL